MASTEAHRPAWHVFGWALVLVAAVVLFRWLGQGALAAPPLGDLDALQDWRGQRSAPEVVFAGLRLGVLALAWYLLGVITVGTVARMLGAVRVVAIADLVTVPAVRRLLQQALGLGLAAAAVVSVPGVPTASAPTVTTDERGIALGALAPPPLYWSAGLPGQSAGGLRLPIDGPDRLPGVDGGVPGSPGVPIEADDETADRGDEKPGTGVRPGPDPDPGAGPGHERGVPAPGALAGSAGDEVPLVHTIAAGEHLWSVAEDTLAAAWDRDPADDEVSAYWRAMIDHNRDRLPDPANPDLVHPGLEVELPATPER